MKSFGIGAVGLAFGLGFGSFGASRNGGVVCFVLYDGESGFGASLGAAVCVCLTGCLFTVMGGWLQQAAMVFRGELVVC